MWLGHEFAFDQKRKKLPPHFRTAPHTTDWGQMCSSMQKILGSNNKGSYFANISSCFPWNEGLFYQKCYLFTLKTCFYQTQKEDVM